MIKTLHPPVVDPVAPFDPARYVEQDPITNRAPKMQHASGESRSIVPSHSMALGSCPSLQLQYPLTPSQAQQANAQRRIKEIKWTLWPTPR